MSEIREETSTDLEAIREVNRLAFEGEEEGRLIDRLRADGLLIASLVAEEQEQIVGHILFSGLPIEIEKEGITACSLAPMSVRPEAQRRGIGSELVKAGLETCRARGCQAVVVLGHPEYYPRFGFSSGMAQTLRSPFSGSEAFMALELIPGALASVAGTVRYPDAFGLVT